MLWFLKKNPPDKIFPGSYMDFEQKYQKDPGMNRVEIWANTLTEVIFFLNLDKHFDRGEIWREY